MPDTVVGVVVAIGLVLPGFVIAELSMVGRARIRTNELETVLRALFYAFLLHLVFSAWTRDLVLRVGSPDQWTDHLDALALYASIVLVVLPVGIGVLLGRYLRHVESEGPPSLLYSVLGARDARDAWDYAFQRFQQGVWLIVELTDGRLVAGMYGQHSAVGQSPSEHDLFLQELWDVDDSGLEPNLLGRVDPPRAMWLAASQIRSIRVLDPPHAQLQSPDG